MAGTNSLSYQGALRHESIPAGQQIELNKGLLYFGHLLPQANILGRKLLERRSMRLELLPQ